MAIKLIVIDIDGTLLDSDGYLPEENKQAIQQANEADIKIVLCTGRPFQSTKHFMEELDLFQEDDMVITNNGGLIQKSKKGEIIHEIRFNRDEILDIYKLAQKLKMPVNFIDLDYIYEPSYPAGSKSIYTGGNVPRENALKFVDLDINNLAEDFEVNQIIISRPSEELDAIIPKIPESYYEKYKIYKSLSFILEFLPKDVDKGNSLDIIRKILDLEKDEVMSIGDQENDLSLIKKAGFGVAMGNAVEEVKQVADYITKSNDENGLAYAIKKFVL